MAGGLDRDLEQSIARVPLSHTVRAMINNTIIRDNKTQKDMSDLMSGASPPAVQGAASEAPADDTQQRLVSLNWLPTNKKGVTERWAREFYKYRHFLNTNSPVTSSPSDAEIAGYMREAVTVITQIAQRSKLALLRKIKTCHTKVVDAEETGRAPMSIEDVAMAYTGEKFTDRDRAKLVGGILVHPDDGWLIKEERDILNNLKIAGYEGRSTMRNSERNGCIHKIVKQTASDCIKYATKKAWERTLGSYIGTRTSPQLLETHTVTQITGVSFTAYKVKKKEVAENATNNMTEKALLDAARAYLESGHSMTDAREVIARAGEAATGKIFL